MPTKSNLKKLIYISGITGSAIILLCSLITAIAYRDINGHSYNILNHFISELGEIGVSKLAPVFNTGLIVGGIIFIIFMISLGVYIRTVPSYIASIIGAFSAISCSLVGFNPMNDIEVHVKVAMWFFYGGLIAITFFSIAIIFDKQNKLSKKLLIPGIITILSFASFLWLPRVAHTNIKWTLDPSKIVRPEIWWNTIFEWLVFLTIIAWIIIVSFSLMKKKTDNPG
jgi:hypothetical membrane protein